MATRSAGLVWIAILLCVACGGSPTSTAATPPSPSPTVDAATQQYVALIRGYWSGIRAADNWHGSSNEAALVCLGQSLSSGASSLSLVNPARCHARALAILAVQQEFLSELKGAAAPAMFAADDRILRSQVPLAIVAIEKLITVSATDDRQSIIDAANAYVAIMLSTILPALDDVDPSTPHA